VASVRGLRAGCVLAIVNEMGVGDIPAGAATALDPLIATAVEALRLLIRRDRGEADGS
jgi:hypothetical protein